MPKIVDGKLREILETTQLLLEYGAPEDRFRVSSALAEVLSAGATLATVEWAADYLRERLPGAEQRRAAVRRNRATAPRFHSDD
jgi:hypothetical protein